MTEKLQIERVFSDINKPGDSVDVKQLMSMMLQENDMAKAIFTESVEIERQNIHTKII
jgi:hypothetical protein